MPEFRAPYSPNCKKQTFWLTRWMTAARVTIGKFLSPRFDLSAFGQRRFSRPRYSDARTALTWCVPGLLSLLVQCVDY